MKILAIGAHPDDIEFYAGGTLAKMAKGHELVYLLATSGENGFHKKQFSSSVTNIRKIEQQKAAKILGVKRVIFLSFHDGELENNVSSLKGELLKVILQEKPEIIFTLDPEKQYSVHADFHPDHRTIALAALDVILIDATLPIKGGFSGYRPKIYLYNASHPNNKVSIKKYREIKVKALNQFKSQELVLQKQGLTPLFEEFKVYF